MGSSPAGGARMAPSMASRSSRLKSAGRALIVVLLGLALLYFAFLALLSAPFGGLESSGSVSGGTVLWRPPVAFDEAVSLVQQGRVQLVDIDNISDDQHFLLLPSPFQPQANPIHRWAVRGYVVQLYAADERDGVAVLTPGESTIGLDDPDIGRLLQEIDNLNRAAPCRVVVLDHRSSTALVASPSPEGCPVPTSVGIPPLSPEEGLAEGIARPPLSVAEARQMILDGRVEVLRLRSERYPDGIQRAYRYLDDGNQQLLRVRGIDVLLYDLSRPDSRPVTNSSTAVGVNEAELQSLLDAVNEASQNGKVTQVIDERS